MTSLGKGALIFFGGVLFGTAGIKALSSRDAKKAYTHCTAAALRAKKSVMETVTKVQENAEDIYAEAKQINLEREESENPIESEPEKSVVTESKKAVESEPEKTVESTEENEI
ncbi:DUF6110 family protein [Ruminococcus sp. JL13D9]|uniref:DUF6110 family protein n=1 Tax=Ruminococcus sp. JL13D9 TaxID=3233381 RepID=UPI003899C2A0